MTIADKNNNNTNAHTNHPAQLLCYLEMENSPYTVN